MIHRDKNGHLADEYSITEQHPEHASPVKNNHDETCIYEAEYLTPRLNNELTYSSSFVLGSQISGFQQK